MEPRLFDIVWEVYRSVGAGEPVHVVSAYRAPETNAMLRRRSRAVSEFSQHMAGKALDFYLPDVDMARVRSIGMRLQHGGVGFYPNSAHSFVHLDAGSVRAWPRMTRGQLMALFPDGKTVHLPTDNKPLARYEEARAEILAKGGAVAGMAYASAEDSGGRRSLWATLFGGGDEDEDFYGTRGGRGGRSRAAQEAAAYVPSSSGDDAGTRGVLAFAAPEPSRGLTRRSPAPAPAEAAAAQTAAIAPKEAAPAEDAASPLASVPLPPKRPGDVIDIAALAFMPMPPARPIELASAMIGLPTRSDATAGAFPAKALPEAPAARLTSEERIHLRALFATVASGAAPGPRVKIATARAKPQAGAPGGHVAAASAGPRARLLGESSRPAGRPLRRPGREAAAGSAVAPSPAGEGGLGPRSSRVGNGDDGNVGGSPQAPAPEAAARLSPPRSGFRPSSDLPCGEGSARRCAQKIEVAAFVGLQHPVVVELRPAARRRRRGGRACGAAAGQLGIVDEEVEPALLDADADAVAVAHEPERPAVRRLRRDVEHDGAVGGAAHARVGQAQHVLDARRRELLRDRQVAGLRHAAGLRAGVLQHERVVRPDVEVGIVDAGREVVERGEHHRSRGLLEQPRVGGGALEDRALRGERAVERDEPAHVAHRILDRADHRRIDEGALGQDPVAEASRR